MSDEVATRILARILTRMSATSRACRACRRGCHENATRKLLSWNLGLTVHVCWAVCSGQRETYVCSTSMPRSTCLSSGQMSAVPAYAASTCSHSVSRSHTSPISSRLSNEHTAVVPSVAHTCIITTTPIYSKVTKRKRSIAGIPWDRHGHRHRHRHGHPRRLRHARTSACPVTSPFSSPRAGLVRHARFLARILARLSVRMRACRHVSLRVYCTR